MKITWNKYFNFRYINHPENENVTLEYIKSGEYEIDVMNKRYPVDIKLKGIFDPENKKLNPDLPLRVSILASN